MQAIAVILPLLVEAHQYDPLLPLETRTNEVRGYELYSLQLIRPYSNGHNWDLKGDAFISRNKVRLTREAQLLHGSVWSRNRLSSRNWEIQASLRVYTLSDPPADGIAIWYIQKPDTGSAWGGPTNFSGIAVVMDTYLNAPNSYHQSCRLFVLLNTPSFEASVDVDVDGANLNIGSECELRSDVVSTVIPPAHDYTPTIKILVRYVHETLQVLYAVPSHQEEHWEACLNISGVFLPINYHVGVSAATGALKSTHELLSLRVYEIETPTHFSGPVNFPMYLGFRPEPVVNEEYSFWDNFLYYVEMALVVTLVMATLYGMYYITDKLIDDNFVMARPRKRFY